ncbi:pirin family protein [Streptomyces sp. TP-A0874]|uniref:pirin family protein n=1 Tax=Streptomyces sp. TP-A0874 TaxID=549819 RepID=UPI000852D995|nr:pirin family protein [Streptomyces sp. TP-A0874]
MGEVWRAADRFRGGDPAAGIETFHAFSFGSFYEPDNLRFGALIACNEERLALGAGFAEHPHRDTEIVTWVVEGELTHRDSTGTTTLLRAGDLQRLSAAGGVRHTERNDGDQPLVFVQMWLEPVVRPGGEPEYEVVRGLGDGTPYEVDRAGAVLHARRLRAGARSALPTAPSSYLHLVRGTALLDGETLHPGDAARLSGGRRREVVAEEDSELLVWELGEE